MQAEREQPAYSAGLVIVFAAATVVDLLAALGLASLLFWNFSG